MSLANEDLKHCPNCGEPNAVKKNQTTCKCRKCPERFDIKSMSVVSFPNVDTETEYFHNPT